MPTKELLVELDDVSKMWKDRFSVKKINLKIYKGETICLLGPNGAGKTVLSKIIAHNIKHDSGIIEYYFDDPEITRAIGLQLRNQTWPNGFFTKDVIELYKNIYSIKNNDWIDILLDTLDIRHIYNSELSKVTPVQLQLFSMFLALIHKPQLLVLDEISSTLDYNVRMKIAYFLKDYVSNNERSIVIASLETELIEMICDRVIFLNLGKIFNQTTIEEIHQQDSTIVKYLQQTNKKIIDLAIQVTLNPKVLSITKTFSKLGADFKNIHEDLLKTKIFENFKELEKNIISLEFYNNSLLKELSTLEINEIDKSKIHNVKSTLTLVKKTVLTIYKIIFQVNNKKLNPLKFEIILAKRALITAEKQLHNIFHNQVEDEEKALTKKIKQLKKQMIRQEVKFMKQERRLSKKLQLITQTPQVVINQTVGDQTNEN